jgi:subtilisin family serine protease
MNRMNFPKAMFLLPGIVFALSMTALAQTGSFKNGVKQGQIKVKFTSEMTSTLNRMNVTARTSGFTTGIRSVDNAARTTKANNMYRLFPYDPKFEHKLRKHGLHLWYVVEIDANTDPASAVAEFRQLNEVDAAEVEHEKALAPYEVKPYVPTASTYDVLPFNDPLLKDQWHYNNTNQIGYGDADINLFEAWKSTTGSNDVIVSIHDQGVDVNHIDLKANIWVNYAEKNGQVGVDDDANGYVDDINGYNFQKNTGAVDAENHGTHVAGTIAAVNNNGIGVGGVAGGNGSGNGVKIMSLEILGGAPIEKSYVYAANNGAVISQNSWGYTSPDYVDLSVLDAIQYFVEEAGDYDGSPMRGGLVLFAAGNSNSDGHWYPGYYSSTMSVASLGPEWKRAPYSNFGGWVELSAPGGDQSSIYGSKGGVLSTIPNGQYAYMQGTSMACPHMSGVAALALANRNHQLVLAELWNKLLTGTVNIDAHNPSFIGKLGSGAIDASLAIKNSSGIAPAAITNLAVKDIAQELAKLTWTVPADEDDGRPISFTIHYSNQPITEGNLVSTSKLIIKNDSLAGKTINAEVGNLLGLTHYYFAVISRDRWGIPSPLSNILEFTTNDGPVIVVTPTTIGGTSQSSPTWVINAATSTIETQAITIKNNAAGLLRYSSFVRPRAAATSPTFIEEGIIYPADPGNGPTMAILGRTGSEEGDGVVKLYNNEPAPLAFTPISKPLMSGNALYMIGETDTSLPNSAASRFTVTETGGFNLTNLKMTWKLTRAATTTEPIVVEIYNGKGLAKANRLLAQTATTSSLIQTVANITLIEQLYFAQGESFWVVFHFPNGNLFPAGVGLDADPTFSTQCYYSSDVGATWQTLDDAMNDRRFVWAMEAVSNNAGLETYLSLAPASGDISGLNQRDAVITADASKLINGNYAANLVIPSNDATNPELRVPVYLKVQNHQPNLKIANIADYNSVFLGSKKSFDIVLDNQGYGRIASMTATGGYAITGPGASQFILEGTKPSAISARDQALLRVSFVPTIAGASNATLTILGKSGNNINYTYTISLFGVGAETSKITVTPEIQTKTPLAIGQTAYADVVVQNSGAFPLKYFIPGYDTKGVSDNWPSAYHTYGYRLRTSYVTDPNPLTNNFQDIKTTGVDITRDLSTSSKYYELDMGFDFPYYGTTQKKIYIAQKGFTTFDNSVSPINTPPLIFGLQTRPAGYISPLGTFLSFVSQGKILYKKEADRVIIQYDNVVDGTNPQAITAQIVLYSNGDIRFYYPNMGFTVSNQRYLNILIEDVDKKDGIILHNYNKIMTLSNGTAFGFDYPGPNIITGITNGSGVLAPGASATVTVNMNTATLAEGVTNRFLNIISNDPANGQKTPLIQLDVTSGGVAQPAVSTNTIAFGNVFQGAARSQVVTIKNTGKAAANITSMAFANGNFIVTGDAPPVSVKPGLYKEFAVVIPTGTIKSLEDDLVISYANASTYTIHVTGNVVSPPGIGVDLTAVNQTLNYKETASVPFAIENTGTAPLEVSVTGKQWVTCEATSATPASVTYDVEKHNTGGVYQWIDIRKTGTHVEIGDVFTPEGFWEQVALPFPFEYYGVTYDKIQLGFNGLVSFDPTPPVMVFADAIPSANYHGAFIMPYWTFGGFDAVTYPAEDVGIFYQNFEDKMIITWSHFENNFGGMGDPMSAQLFLYKNGTIRFQYRNEVYEGSGDQSSQFTFVGLQKNSSEGITISPKLALDYGMGNGLAYIMVPDKKHVVGIGETLNGSINFNSFNVYGGTYNADLKIKSNAPANELKLKPVQLTVNALAIYDAPASFDFGAVMIPNTNGFQTPIEIRNTGSASLTITNLKYRLGNQKFDVAAYAYTYNYLPGAGDPAGWGWRTTSLTFCAPGITPPHNLSQCNIASLNITPSEAQKLIIRYSPTSAATNNDNLDITTNVGTYTIATKGSSYRAPGLVVAATPINSAMNDLESSETRQIAFSASNTNNGQGNLDYTVNVDFGRVGASSAESMASTQDTEINLISAMAATGGAQAGVTGTYNRTISYTAKAAAETYIGTGGSSPFAVATKYQAGPDGFTVSHVETYFRSETVTSGKILVEIRAGGASVATAAKVGEGSYTFATEGGDAGSWITIALNKSTVIYPNETFYVIVTSPLGVRYPQGVVNDPSTTSGRYFYYDVGQSTWFDLNLVSGFKAFGWLMLAAEQTAGVTSWLTITSALSGSLAPGASNSIALTMDSHYAARGMQIASIVLTTNDPTKKVSKIPVSLHVNEAPEFVAIDAVVINEGETKTVKIGVVDKEGHSFTIQPTATYAGVTHAYNNGILSVTLAPDYGTAGKHSYAFTAIDQHGAGSDFVLQVNVGHTNRAPVYTPPGSALAYRAGSGVFEYAIANYFSDPDNDGFTFGVSSSASTVAEVYASANKFYVKPLATGSGTLQFTATDVHGATRTAQLTVEVAANQAPNYIAEQAAFSLTAGAATAEYLIANYFKDPEGDSYTFTLTSGTPGKAEVFVSNNKFFVKPIAAGISVLTFVVTDAYGALTNKQVTVTITEPVLNQAPVFIATGNTLELTAKTEMTEYQIANFFRDPEGDAFVFTVTSSNENVVVVLTTPTKFFVKPLANGQSMLKFKLTDSRGASSQHEVTVNVAPVMAVETSNRSYKLQVYPNPSTGILNVRVAGIIKPNYQVRVINTLGISVLENVADGPEMLLDMTHLPKGVYLLEVNDNLMKSVQHIIIY